MNTEIISDLEAKVVNCNTILSMLKTLKKHNLTKEIEEYEEKYAKASSQLKIAIKKAPDKYQKIIGRYEKLYDDNIKTYNNIMGVRE